MIPAPAELICLPTFQLIQLKRVTVLSADFQNEKSPDLTTGAGC